MHAPDGVRLRSRQIGVQNVLSLGREAWIDHACDGDEHHVLLGSDALVPARVQPHGVGSGGGCQGNVQANEAAALELWKQHVLLGGDALVAARVWTHSTWLEGLQKISQANRGDVRLAVSSCLRPAADG
eukprot:358300-Chlamydomonas_euryale.AAC.3